MRVITWRATILAGEIKYNKNIISGDGSENINKRGSEKNQNNFEGPKPVPRKL